MSWFETVKNVAKVVAKGVAGVSPTTVGGTAVASAVPLDHHGLWSVLSRPSTSANGPDDVESSESESDSERPDDANGSSVVTTQVTTRARFTYELDRYEKNALLMFVQMRSEPSAGCRKEETTTQDIDALLNTLTGFRFEINTHIDLTCNDIKSKCQEFFQQDFSNYGSVIVVILTFGGVMGQLSALDGRFSESIILRHLTEDLNSTLLANPKYTLLRVRRPILLLCDNIKEMADTYDFATILKKSVAKIEREAQCILQDKPIELSVNFSKEMLLARS